MNGPCRRTALCGLLLSLVLATGTTAANCLAPGDWRTSAGEKIPTDRLFDALASAEVVLLGESHDRMEHHRWQLHTLAALHARRPDMAIALEMLPRSAQPALDAWVAGELDERTFLDQSDWSRAWGFDAQLYLPILHFARMHRIPVLAINLERSLVGRLTSEGWEAVPEEERYRITAPAAPSPAYRDYLASVLAEHPTGVEDGGDLERFVAAQLVWDRAMAAGLAEAIAGGTLAVGLMGRGHVEYGYGVPHQLIDLGIREPRILLPWEIDSDCSLPEPGLADAVFALASGTSHEPPRPLLLGVRIENDPAGVKIQFVMEESVAEAAGLQVDDVLTSAGGLPLTSTGDLVSVIRRQQPGHVVPLRVLREGEEIELLARFPASTD